MQILEPIVHETVWGGSALTKYSGTDCQKIGHLYSAIDTPEFRNYIRFNKFFYIPLVYNSIYVRECFNDSFFRFIYNK